MHEVLIATRESYLLCPDLWHKMLTLDALAALALFALAALYWFWPPSRAGGRRS
jgi:hypothetical protein